MKNFINGSLKTWFEQLCSDKYMRIYFSVRR